MEWLWSMEDSGRKIQKIAQVLQILAVVTFGLCVLGAGIWTIYCFCDLIQSFGYWRLFDFTEWFWEWIIITLAILFSGFVYVVSHLVLNLFIHAFGSMTESIESMLYIQVKKDMEENAEK